MRGEPKRLSKGGGGVNMIYAFSLGGTHKRSKTTWLFESTSTHPSLTSPSMRTHHSINASSHHSALIACGEEGGGGGRHHPAGSGSLYEHVEGDTFRSECEIVYRVWEGGV